MSVVPFDGIVTYVFEAANYSQSMNPNAVKTLHDIECPPGRGWVVSLMGPSYFGNPNTQASAQLMVDAADVGQGVTLGYGAWHIGGPGNQISDGMEQAGYANFTRPMWTGQEQIGATYVLPNGSTSNGWTQQNNVDMAAQLELVARTMARLHIVCGTELKWLTEAEHRQAVDDYNNGRPATISGWVRHEDWTNRQLSSTTHHDTGDNYPCDLVMAKAIAYANGGTNPTPAPTPSGGFGTMDDATINAKFLALNTKLDAVLSAISIDPKSAHALNVGTIGAAAVQTVRDVNAIVNATHATPANI